MKRFGNPFGYDMHNRCAEGKPALLLETSIYNPTSERSINLVVLCESEEERDALSAAFQASGWGEWESITSDCLINPFYQQWVAGAWRLKRNRGTLKAVLDDLRAQMDARPRTRCGPRARMFGIL